MIRALPCLNLSLDYRNQSKWKLISTLRLRTRGPLFIESSSKTVMGQWPIESSTLSVSAQRYGSLRAPQPGSQGLFLHLRDNRACHGLADDSGMGCHYCRACWADRCWRVVA